MRLAGILLCAAILGATTPVAAHCLPYFTQISLSGSVVRTMFYGPPNFGEDPRHDERGYYPVLRLDRAIRMCPLEDEPATGPIPAVTARRLQMILFDKVSPFALYGHHVTVIAKLFPWHTAWHHTPVMLELLRMKRIQ